MVRLGLQALDEVRRRRQQQIHGHRGRKDDPLFKLRRVLRVGQERLYEATLAKIFTRLRDADTDDEVAACPPGALSSGAGCRNRCRLGHPAGGRFMTTDRTPTLSAKVLAFQTCEQCSYDFRTDEGERGCHYYECPSLPEALDVWCPTCRYNFMIRDGNPECGDTPRCDFARMTAPVRVAALEEWLRSRGR